MTEEPAWLYRFGVEPESAGALERLARTASDAGIPHGVSASTRGDRHDAMRASYAEVAARFPVHKTGRTRYHYTIELPEPVSDDDAQALNQLFGKRPE